MPESNHHLVRIFKDAAVHQEVAKIIAQHLSTKVDIRDVALDGIGLSGVENILDLGCGFGFFTEGLKGKLNGIPGITGIDCHPEYEWFYFNSCERVNINMKKHFISSGSESIKNIESDTFDLVLCSYAMYFFPDVVKEVSRILKKDGTFLVITHAMPHLKEFTDFVRRLLLKNGIRPEKQTPYEILLNNFSDKNGMKILRQGFKHIRTKEFRSTLVFQEDDYESFATYFNFKHSFFIPQHLDPDDHYHQLVLETVREHLGSGNEFHINKDDMIYICSEPLNTK